jgi:hypothetical protein
MSHRAPLAREPRSAQSPGLAARSRPLRSRAKVLSHPSRHLAGKNFGKTTPTHRVSNAAAGAPHSLVVPAETLRCPGSRTRVYVIGAKTRKGTPCLRRELFNSGRCRNQGGMSTGPKTADGKRRRLEAMWRGLRRWHAEQRRIKEWPIENNPVMSQSVPLNVLP